VLLTENSSPEVAERLAIMERTPDGFKIAEEDLRLRGPGEFFGTRQTGLPELRMARLEDWALLQAAREDARAVLTDDPSLSKPEHVGLRTLVPATRRRQSEIS
jgi:ATP-dependent DNA helicase RecG